MNMFLHSKSGTRTKWSDILNSLALVELDSLMQFNVVMIVPQGVLFRGSVKGRICPTLIEGNMLDAVIGLLPNLFPSLSIPVAVQMLDRNSRGGKLGQGVEWANVIILKTSPGHCGVVKE